MVLAKVIPILEVVIYSDILLHMLAEIRKTATLYPETYSSVFAWWLS